MKKEIIAQVNLTLEKQDKESIKNTLSLLEEIIDTRRSHDCEQCMINSYYRDTDEFTKVIDFLNDLYYGEIIIV